MPQTTLLSYFGGSGPAVSSVSRGPPTPPANRKIELPHIARLLEAASTGAASRTSSIISEPPLNPIPPLPVSHYPSETVDEDISEIPSRIAIIAIQHSHLPALQRLTSTLLPVKYPDKFFTGAVDEIIPANFSRVALYESKPVGWIRCRLDPFPEETSPPSATKPIYNRLYVQALCLLAPFRGLGSATALLDAVLKPSLLHEHDVEFVYAHVWESNIDALAWYEKRGFHQVVLIENYYRKLRPGGAWIVRRDVR